MQIAIYQINMQRDYNRVAFESYERLGLEEDPGNLDSEIYDRVFEGEVDCDNLEDVYRMFNLNHPEGYRGRSLSVSDIVEIRDSEKAGFYYCDSFGFRQVSFDPDLAETLKEDKITVVLCEPGKMARVTEIGNELSDLQNAVKGDIEAFYPFEEQVCIVCNDEGKFNGSAPNRAVYREPEEIEMTYGELSSKFREAEQNGSGHVTGYIVFTADSFDKSYPIEARTYVVSSDNKAFQPNMGGYSIYASSLDGSDPMVRLERYMQNEKGGKDGWKIERCYMKSDEKEMLDIIFGTFFICDCKNEHFGSLSKEQQEHYLKEFRNPERFFRINDDIKAVPYEPRETSKEER